MPDRGKQVRDADRTRRGSVKVLEKALTLLGQFSGERPEWGLTELVRDVGMAKTTTYRILRVLTRYGYLSQDGRTARFRLGPALRELGRRAEDAGELRRVALPILARVAQESGETALLMVPNPALDRAICVEQIGSRRGLRVLREVGTELPLHAGASAKVLLAYLEPEVIRRVVDGGLARLARHTITGPRALLRDLTQIRAAGYAYSAEETNEGAAGVAVAVLDDQGRVHASVGIAGPLLRFPKGRVSRFVALAREAAAELARQAGLGRQARDGIPTWRESGRARGRPESGRGAG